MNLGRIVFLVMTAHCLFASFCFSQEKKLSDFDRSKLANTPTDSSINKVDANGRKAGFWKEKKETFEQEGFYINGIKDGLWTSYFTDGLVQSIENYSHGKLDGIYLQMKQGGLMKIQAHYKNGVFDGNYKEFNGTRVDKEMVYKNGKLNGIKKMFYMNGKLMEEGNYTDNVRSGYARWFTEDGKPALESNYVNGNLEGIQKSYYPDGKLNSETAYKKNMMNGSFIEYFEDGKAIKLNGNYVNDKREGDWQEFDKEGKLIKKRSYKDDLEISK